MPFLGSQPADQYQSLAKQTITGDGSTSYTLNRSVTNAYDMEVFINNVRQEPDTSYSASGNTITFTAAVTASDSCYLIYQGQSVGSINPPANSVGSNEIQANSVGGNEIQNTSVTTAHLHTSLDLSSKTLTMPAGHIIQVVQATTATGLGNITSTSFVEIDTNLRCTITPKFANSNLLVMFHSMMYKSGGSNPWGVATVYRDGSDIFGGTYGPGYTQGVGANTGDIHSGKKIVAANNTNSTTFSIYVRAGSGYTMHMESSDRHVMVMEIAQ